MNKVIFVGVVVISSVLSAAGGWFGAMGYAFSQAQAEIAEIRAEADGALATAAQYQAELKIAQDQYSALREQTAEIISNEELRGERIDAVKGVAKDAATAGARSIWQRITED